MSLPVTEGGTGLSIVTCSDSGTRSHNSPVAHSAATSLRPTPAPKAPIHPKCGVWLSAPRTSCPGRTIASSLRT